MSDGFDSWWQQQHVSPYQGCTADHVKAAWKAGREWGRRDTVMSPPSGWISVDDRLPAYGEPVLIKANSVTQHVTYVLDGADECPDWFEPHHFDHDDDLKMFWNKVKFWRPLPE